MIFLNKSMMILLLLIYTSASIILVNSAPNKRKRTFEETFQFDGRLGIPIARGNQIQQYEKEHMMMYRKEDGTSDKAKYGEWPLKLGEVNLTEYCKKYLQAVIPRRNVVNVFAEPKIVQLVYLHKGDGFEQSIGAIKCEIPPPKSFTTKAYYITEAPETECVYILMRCNKGIRFPFKIVFKVCGFLTNDAPVSIYSNMKPVERRKSVIKVHRKTGIPITTKAFIKQYETKHQEMHETENGVDTTGKYLAWPLNQNQTYLTNFCAKYLETIVPNKVKVGLNGEPDELELHYTETNVIPLKIGIIKCVLPAVEGVRNAPIQYYITESPEPDCVYSLLRTTSAPICNIVYQICGIKGHEVMEGNIVFKQWNSPANGENKWEMKTNVNTFGNMNISNQTADDTEEWDNKPNLKTFNIFPTE